MDTTILGALIGLLGTLITIYVGYRQWRHQQDRSFSSGFQESRKAVYEKLWNLLPDPSIFRERENKLDWWIDSLNEQELSDTLEQVQLFSLRNELYIEESDKLLSIQYLEDLLNLKQLASKLNSFYESSLRFLDNMTNRTALKDQSKYGSKLWDMLDQALPAPLMLKLLEASIERHAARADALLGKQHEKLFEPEPLWVKLLIFWLDVIKRIQGLWLPWFVKIYFKSLENPQPVWLVIVPLFVRLFVPSHVLSMSKEFVRQYKQYYAAAVKARKTRKRFVFRMRQVIAGKA